MEAKSFVSRVLFPRERGRRSFIWEPRYRDPRATNPGVRRSGPLLLPYSVLLQVGFTEPPPSPEMLVSSYLTVSPLPRCANVPRRFAFCCTFRGIASPGSYPALRPVELGLSSRPVAGTRDRLNDFAIHSCLGTTRCARFAHDGSDVTASSAAFASASARAFDARGTCSMSKRAKRARRVVAAACSGTRPAWRTR